MAEINPSMRPKVKGDTYYLPDPDGGVYFRNNAGSFRLQGEAIDQWIEQLIPVFNGEYSLEQLTDGLPDEYRDRVYDIAGTLFQNGFVRDVQEDRPHRLEPELLRQYASQIELLDSFGDSGAYRFQLYRESRVLAVGSGPMLVSLVASLFESGMPLVNFLCTSMEEGQTDRDRVEELAAHAHKLDQEVKLEEVSKDLGLREAVEPFAAVLYVSQDGDLEELRELQKLCAESGKMLIPAMIVHQAGWAGPLVHPDEPGSWESAWRRIHENKIYKDPHLHRYSSVAGAMLSNVIVFEWFKTVTGLADRWTNRFFLMNLETMEGEWLSFIPHPLVTERVSAAWVDDVERRFKQDNAEVGQEGLFSLFGRLASEHCGIFASWEEEDLKQSPLAQCRVQAFDPLSEGPAGTLPAFVAAGLTHMEARREAGLAGAEAYAARMAGASDEFVGFGCGESFAECVCRGLQKCLERKLQNCVTEQPFVVRSVFIETPEDEHFRFYLQALTELKGSPNIALGEKVCGFPIVWVESGGRWYGSPGLNVTLALRSALLKALQSCQSVMEEGLRTVGFCPVRFVDMAPKELKVPDGEMFRWPETLEIALEILKLNGIRADILELSLEPVWKEASAGFYGVRLREGDA